MHSEKELTCLERSHTVTHQVSRTERKGKHAVQNQPKSNPTVPAYELHQNDSVCQKKERNDFVDCISNSRCTQKERNDVKKMMGKS